MKNFKKFTAFVLALCMLFSLSISAFAAEKTPTGYLTWTLDDSGTLSISGNGRIAAFTSAEDQPWHEMLHEISHATLHRRKKNEPPYKDQHTREVEAESVAYVVCQHFGIDTSDYSFGYVAGWSKGKELDELKASLDTIRSCAAGLIDAIESKCPSLQPKKEPTQSFPKR